ncbi:tetratricopeptide repeat protein [Phytobacter sp. AG2a]
MDSRLQNAIQLRKQGEHEQSRAALHLLLDNPQLAAQALLHIAWSFDNEGKEREAEQAYRAALNAGLDGEERFDAQFGLASTLRCLGKYAEAKANFEEIRAQWPLAIEVRPFHALCLHNLGEHQQAIALLLEHIADSPDVRTAPYEAALRHYAQQPDKKW